MIKKIAAVLNIVIIITFIFLMFFNVHVKGVLKIILHILVLITPVFNLYALEFLNSSKLKSFLLNRRFKVTLVASLFLIIVLSSVLMTQGKDSEVYVIAFSNVVGKDDTYGGRLNPKKVYLSKNYLVYSSQTYENLTEKTVEALKNYCNANSIELILYDDGVTFQYNDLGEVEGGGVIVSFGEIHKTLVFSNMAASIYIAGEASGQTMYTLNRWFGGWKIFSSKQDWVS